MRIFQLARNLPQGMRATLAAVLLIFAANTVAAAAHEHKDSHAPAHASVCVYCTTFGSVADGPVHANAAASVLVVLLVRLPGNVRVISGQPLSRARARAPPAF